jgi:hypothetical protein
MTSLEEQEQKQQQEQEQHYLALALVDFVNSDAGWKVYLNPHCTQRDIFFKRLYIEEYFDRNTAIREILKFYIPMLIREYIKYNKGESRMVNMSEFTDAVKLETANLILNWIIAECSGLYKQSKVSKWKKTMSWL